MTIATTRNFEFSISQIIRIAYREAGLLSVYQTPDAQQSSHACDLLEMIAQSDEVEGFLARMVDFYTVTLVAGTYVYTLPDYVVSLVDQAMYIDPTQTDLTKANGETPVSAIDRGIWQLQSAKGATGRPVQYFANRVNSLLQVNFWPVPSSSEDGGHVRFQVHKFRADMRDANATPDYERYWVQYLVYRLAHDLTLGGSLPLDRVAYFKALAKEQLDKAKNFASELNPIQLRIG